MDSNRVGAAVLSVVAILVGVSCMVVGGAITMLTEKNDVPGFTFIYMAVVLLDIGLTLLGVALFGED